MLIYEKPPPFRLRMYALWVVNLNLASESPGPRFKLDLE